MDPRNLEARLQGRGTPGGHYTPDLPADPRDELEGRRQGPPGPGRVGGPEDDLQALPPPGRGAPPRRLRGDVRTEARTRGPGGPRLPMTAKRKRTSPNGGVRR